MRHSMPTPHILHPRIDVACGCVHMSVRSLFQDSLLVCRKYYIQGSYVTSIKGVACRAGKPGGTSIAL